MKLNINKFKKEIQKEAIKKLKEEANKKINTYRKEIDECNGAVNFDIDKNLKGSLSFENISDDLKEKISNLLSLRKTFVGIELADLSISSCNNHMKRYDLK